MKRLLTATVIAALALTAGMHSAFAEAPADFSGTWVLNTDKGANLGMMKAVKETIVATQTDDQIVFDMTDVFMLVETTRQVTYDLNGAPVDNVAAMGDKSTTVTGWEDDKLVTTWTAEGAIAGSEVVRTETRWLSEDGKELSVSMVRGDNPAMVFVYEKRE